MQGKMKILQGFLLLMFANISGAEVVTGVVTDLFLPKKIKEKGVSEKRAEIIFRVKTQDVVTAECGLAEGASDFVYVMDAATLDYAYSMLLTSHVAGEKIAISLDGCSNGAGLKSPLGYAVESIWLPE